MGELTQKSVYMLKSVIFARPIARDERYDSTCERFIMARKSKLFFLFQGARNSIHFFASSLNIQAVYNVQHKKPKPI